MTTNQDRSIKRPRVAPHIRQMVKSFALQGDQPGTIYRNLLAMQKAGVLYVGAVPAQRSIERIVKEFGTSEKNEEDERRELTSRRQEELEREIRSVTPEQRRAALDLLAALMQEGSMRWPDPDMVDLVARLMPLAPGLGHFETYLLAMFVTAELHRATVDAWLAFRPWESVEACKVYLRAALNHVVPTPLWVYLPEEKLSPFPPGTVGDGILVAYFDPSELSLESSFIQSDGGEDKHEQKG